MSLLTGGKEVYYANIFKSPLYMNEKKTEQVATYAITVLNKWSHEGSMKHAAMPILQKCMHSLTATST